MTGSRPLGGTPLGVAVAHRAGTLDAVPPAAGTPAQEGHRLGAADGNAAAPLAARTSPGVLGDNGYAVLDLLHCCQSLREPVTLIARLRLDAALYAPAPLREPGQNGRPPLKGPRRPPLKTLLEQAT